MTTAHKPTFHPAVGSANQGHYRWHAPKQQISARDLNAHLDMKVRQPGQNTVTEMASRDFRLELQKREKAHEEKMLTEKRRKGLIEDDVVENEQLLITDA